MSSSNMIRIFFNRLAPSWKDDAASAPIREEITARAAFPAGCAIADIGCGKGVMVPHLMYANPRKILELDLSDEMIRFNRNRWAGESKVTFMCDDVLTAELPAIDAAVIFNAYPHFMDKMALAKKLAYALPAGGTLIIAHSMGKESINQIHKNKCSCGEVSIPLKSPLEEYEPFSGYFSLDDWEDSQRLYFMKLTRSPSQTMVNPRCIG